KIGFVPGCLILLVLMTMSSFASAHHLPNILDDHAKHELKTSSALKKTAYKITINELTPWLEEGLPNKGCCPFYSLTSNFYHRNITNGISGTIYDAGGGIPGVLVKIKGTNIFTLTNEFGQFEINAKKGDILI